MAICVALQTDGTLLPTGEAVEVCTGYVLVSASEFATENVIQQAFAEPPVELAQQYFIASFSSILVLYVLARMAGAVAGMFSK